MTLFDAIDRDYRGPARYAESHFAYLKRSARASRSGSAHHYSLDDKVEPRYVTAVRCYGALSGLLAVGSPSCGETRPATRPHVRK